MTTAAIALAAADLAESVAPGERVLAGLPEPADRDPGQRATADRIHDFHRRARRRFLSAHAGGVYDLLTHGRTDRPRLPDLVAAAAERFPGLVPTAAQMAAERGRRQAAREGREIDQALLASAVLRDPAAGRHLMDTMLTPTPAARAALAAFQATGTARFGRVDVRRDGPAAHVTVGDEHGLNAENDALIRDLETAVDLVALADEVTVGVLRGGEMTHPKYAGRRVFSAGINLTDLHEGRISYLEFILVRELGYVSKLLHGVLPDPDADPPPVAVHKPWIAVVDTFAIGGGAQLLLVVDHVIAAEGSYVSLPAAQEGIVPGLANLRLGRFGGGRLARQLVLGGRRLAVDEPDAACLVDEVVRDHDVPAATERAVAALAAPAVAANRRMLALAEEPRELARWYLAEFAVVQAHRLYADDVLAKVAGRRVSA